MINIKEDEINSIRYIISTKGIDGKEILLGNFIKSYDEYKIYNNILTIYTDSFFRMNAKLLSYISNIIQEKFGDLDFTLVTSDEFRAFEDENRYTNENIDIDILCSPEIIEEKLKDINYCGQLSNLFEQQNNEQIELFKNLVDNFKSEFNSSLNQKIDEMTTMLKNE